MESLKAKDILEEVREVLASASYGKGDDGPCVLTGFQILDQLPEPTRSRDLRARIGGADSYAATPVVATRPPCSISSSSTSTPAA
jgi:hypothetical protein